MNNNYILFFVDAIKTSLNDKKVNNENLLKHLKPDSINWYQLQSLAAYHRIKSLLYTTVGENSLIAKDTPFYEDIKKTSFLQSIFDLLIGKELTSILSLLAKHNIAVLPFKGFIYKHILYRNRPLRESTDLDILIHKDQLVDTLLLLLDEGYQFAFTNDVLLGKSTEELIQLILTADGFHEVCLYNKQKPVVQIDIHWDLFEGYLPYKMPVAFLLNQVDITLTNTCKFPNKEAIFWTLLIHHGAREAWLKLKYLADLLFFLENCGDDIAWDQILIKAEQFGMKRIMLTGFYLLEDCFQHPVPPSIRAAFLPYKINHKTVRPIYAYWNYAQERSSLKGRLMYEKALFSMQDFNFSRLNYYRKHLYMHAAPSPFKEKNIVVFPRKYPNLNLLAKTLTYLVRKKWKK